MANSVLVIPAGPLWPLGSIVVSTGGVPVGIMSVVDPNGDNDPNTPTTAESDDYTRRCQQIVFQGFKQTGGAAPMVPNAGNVYILKRGSGSVNRDDAGSLIGILLPGGAFVLASAPLNRNVFSPYDILVDADNNGDSASVLLIIQ